MKLRDSSLYRQIPVSYLQTPFQNAFRNNTNTQIHTYIQGEGVVLDGILNDDSGYPV